MKTKPAYRLRSCFLAGLLGVSAFCLVIVGISALSNLLLPSQSVNSERLTALDKARLAEANHLRQALGDAVWPGFGQANIPVILYNQEYAFLTGLPDPEPGWIKVPANEQRGGPWEVVPGDTFQGEPYYRQRLADPEITPEAFTVLVGDRWVASMTTREWTEIGIAEPILESFPSWLRPILPYKLFIRFMLGDSDRYISLIQHEAFHAYQGQVAGALIAAGEDALHQYGGKYPWDSNDLQADWESEIDLLVKAVRAASREETIELTRQFLARREQRRSDNRLSPELVDYECLRELEEGLAKYVQVQTLQQAATASDYQPVANIELDRDFNRYTTAEKFLNLEISNTKTVSEDSRFYYTGMLQALLLDRLMPGWKGRALAEITLEDLLRQAVR
jgi:hypothetical protein